MDDDHFLHIVGKNHWGTLMKVTYGKLKNAPEIKNGYVNIHLKDTYMGNIKPLVMVNSDKTPRGAPTTLQLLQRARTLHKGM